MKIISWNINGIRSMTGKIKNGEKKGSPTNNVIKTLIEEQQPDVLCFQELKTQNQADLSHYKSNYKYIFTNFSKYKKAYSGVAVMTNIKPQWVSYNFDMYTEDDLGSYKDYAFIDEGRIITVKFTNLILVVVYCPNAQPELARISERLEWEKIINTYLSLLKKEFHIPVVYAGDLNVAPKTIDIHDNKNRDKVAGASKEERGEFQKLLDSGFIDSFRYLHPDDRKYSYFSNFANARENNKGWRIDLMLLPEEFKDKIIAADILYSYYGSDHVPILLEIDV